MSNPTRPARQFLYDKLMGSSNLMTLLTGKLWKQQPPQGTAMPFGFLHRAAGTPQKRVGSKTIDDFGLWDAHFVIGRDGKLSTLESIVSEAMAALDLTLGATTTGLISGCSYVDILDVPYQIGADYYPRNIVRFRVSSREN